MKIVNYKGLVPKGSFVHCYMEYMKGSETPAMFDFHVALWIIGAVVRDVYNEPLTLSRPRNPIALGSYLVLVSSVGNTKRQQAVDYASGLLKKVSDHATIFDYEDKELDIYKSRPKALTDWTNRQSIILNAEASNILSKDIHAKSLLQQLDDGYNKSSSILFSSSPVKLFRDCHPLMMEPEFASKLVFAYSDTPKGIRPWPDETSLTSSIKALDSLRIECCKFAGISINENAVSRYSNWYRRRVVQRDPERSILTSRDDDHLLRYASYLAINDSTFQVQTNHITAAHRLMDDVGVSRDKLFKPIDVGASGRILRGVDRARSSILEAGGDGIRETVLYRGLRTIMSHDEFVLMLHIMHESDMVSKIKASKAGRGRPYYIYRPTNRIHAPAAISDIRSQMGIND